MWRSILAVLLGFALMAALFFGTDQFFASAIDGFDQMAVKPPYYYLISLVTGMAFAIIGGWTCTSVSGDKARVSMKALILLVLVAALTATILLWRSVPRYYLITLLLLFPLSVMFGANSFLWTRPIEGAPVRRRRLSGQQVGS